MALQRTEEFKRDEVRIALTSGLTRQQASSDLGIDMSALNKWISIYRKIDIVSSEDQELLRENERLRKENRILREERKVLKPAHRREAKRKAAIFFAGEKP